MALQEGGGASDVEQYARIIDDTNALLGHHEPSLYLCGMISYAQCNVWEK